MEHSMNLIPQEHFDQLLLNGKQSHLSDFDPMPVIKLFTPGGPATWLLSEIDPDDHERAFGLCDLGEGFPELGWISLAELARASGWLGLGVVADTNFKAQKTIGTYARESRSAGRILA
jgi:hypothetical protein